MEHQWRNILHVHKEHMDWRFKWFMPYSRWYQHLWCHWEQHISTGKLGQYSCHQKGKTSCQGLSSQWVLNSRNFSCFFHNGLWAKAKKTPCFLKKISSLPIKIQAHFNICLGREREASLLPCKNLVKYVSPCFRTTAIRLLANHGTPGNWVGFTEGKPFWT